MVHQRIPEGHRAGKLRRDGCPDEHGALGIGHVPPGGAEPAAQRVAPALIFGPLRCYALLRAGQGGDGAQLDGGKHAEVILRADNLQRVDNRLAADAEADARAGGVKALGQGEKLHADLFGPRDGQKAEALAPVKDDVAVGVVVDQPEAVFPGIADQRLVHAAGRGRAAGIGGVGHHHVFHPAQHLFGDGGHIRQKRIFGQQLIVVHFGSAEKGAGLEHRIARVGQQHHVARVAQRQPQVTDAVLRAVDRADLVRGDGHAVAAGVIGDNSLQQIRTVQQGIFEVGRVAGSLADGADNVLRGGEVRRTDKEVDGFAALGAQLVALLRQIGKNPGLEVVQAVGYGHDVRFLLCDFRTV